MKKVITIASDILTGVPLFILSISILFLEYLVASYLLYLIIYFSNIYPILLLVVSTLIFAPLIKEYSFFIKTIKSSNQYKNAVEQIQQSSKLIEDGYKNKHSLNQLCKIAENKLMIELAIKTFIIIPIVVYFISLYTRLI